MPDMKNDASNKKLQTQGQENRLKCLKKFIYKREVSKWRMN